MNIIAQENGLQFWNPSACVWVGSVSLGNYK